MEAHVFDQSNDNIVSLMIVLILLVQKIISPTSALLDLCYPNGPLLFTLWTTLACLKRHINLSLQQDA